MTAVYSPSKKAWKKSLKRTAQIDKGPEKGKHVQCGLALYWTIYKIPWHKYPYNNDLRFTFCSTLFLALAEENHDSSDEEEGGEILLEMVEQTIGTLDLREYEIYPSRHRRRRRRKKEEPKLPIEGRSAPV